MITKTKKTQFSIETYHLQKAHKHGAGEKKHCGSCNIFFDKKLSLYSNHLHHDTGYKLFCAFPHPSFPSQLRSSVRVTDDCIRGKEKIGDSK